MQHPENILALLEKYFAGTLTPSELDHLNQWYHSFNDDEIELTLDDHEKEDRLFERIKERLLETVREDQHKTARKINRKWQIPVAAAIALLIFISVGYLVFSSKSSTSPVAQKTPDDKRSFNDIAPGSNRAILTLADGSPIILDSVSNGIISHQGNIKVRKLSSGLLVYVINDHHITENDEAFYNKITTPRGGQYQVTFTDGTKVWLNAASSIRFPVVFTGKYREVDITGEAYFEVSKNRAMPFKVKANNSEIEVLGTHFNVNAYDDEAAEKTTLLEGKVKVYALDSQKQSSQFLKPGAQATINKDGKIIIKDHADTEEAVAWMNGFFQFKSADLKTILRQISRWYDVSIEYKENSDMRFTGQLTRNENVSQVLKELALTLEVHFKIDGRKIIVSH
ncbi:MAG: FecR family protein [Ginsengibacter sp.]